MYARARRGEIARFTGVSAPYERPEAADLVVRTAESAVGPCVQAVCAELARRDWLSG